MKSAKVLIVTIILASVVSAGFAFYKFYIARDYFVFANVSCDPTLHSCFVGDGQDTPQYYKKISKRANTIPACDGWLDQCPVLTCVQEDQNCTIEYCETGTGDSCFVQKAISE